MPIVRLSLKEKYNRIAYYERDLKGHIGEYQHTERVMREYLLARPLHGLKNTIALPGGPG